MRIILILTLIFFLGCEKKTSKQTKEINTSIRDDYNKTIKHIANLTFINNKLVYPQKKVVLLFEDNSTFSKLQEKVLQKLKIKFIPIKNKFLENYFNIEIYPTIIIIDKNKTIKYENFTPYEILKEERF